MNLTPAEQEAFEERAAIMRYDGKMSREEAELLALADILKQREQQ